MVDLPFQIRSWVAFAPGRETPEAWRVWAGGRASATSAATRSGGDAPALLRRRVSPLGQAALRAAWALPDVGRGRYVFASRHGEFGRTIAILDSLVAHETPSPADFSLSVHNALVGLLSIAAGNRRGHTAVAAGSDTFGFGLMEAIAGCLESSDEPAILVYYDEPLPAPFDAFEDSEPPPLAAALVLTAHGDGERYLLEAEPTSEGALRSPSLALDFLRFLASGRPYAVAVGERMRWRWRRAD